MGLQFIPNVFIFQQAHLTHFVFNYYHPNNIQVQIQRSVASSTFNKQNCTLSKSKD